MITPVAVLAGVASGVLMALAFAPAALWPLGWVGLAPFFAVLGREAVRPRTALLAGLLFGVTYCGITMYWLTVPVVVGYLAVVAYFGLFYAGAALVLRVVLRGHGWAQPLVAAAAWVGMDLLIGRLFTGIPWLMAGYSQVAWLALIQVADVTGVHGVSFLMALSAAVIARAVNGRTDARAGSGAARSPLRGVGPAAVVWLVLVASAWIYGEIRLRQLDPAVAGDRPGPLLALIQPNIPQALKDSAVQVESREVLARNDRLTVRAVSTDPRPDLVVWAETMNPAYDSPLGSGDFERYRVNLRHYGQRARERYRTAFLLGSIYFRAPPEGKKAPPYFNSALLFDDQGRVVDRYDKLHPIPWAEYAPLGLDFVGKWIEQFSGMPMDMVAGERAVVFPFGPDGTWSFGALVCFDVIYPRYARQMVAGGARFLVNLTNEAWFGRTAEFDQLLNIARFRAVENRVNVARATNSGISARIDARGVVVDRLLGEAGQDRAVEGVLRCRIALPQHRAPYTRWGDIFGLVSAGFALIIFLKNILGKLLELVKR